MEKANEQGRFSILQAVKRSTELGKNLSSGASSPKGSDTFYHGTADNILGFTKAHPNRKDSGWLGEGIYFSDKPGMANAYANVKARDSDPNVIAVHLSIASTWIASLDENKR